MPVEKKNKKINNETPLMKQYNGIKAKYPETILLFRVGDFYETFGLDAGIVAKVLGITLTKRGNGLDKDTALAGFPHHSLNTHLPKLIKTGYRVAVCDQLEDSKVTKKIVKRGVTEVITPGVALNDQVLQHKTNNFLSCIHYEKKQLGISFLDVSTGEFLCTNGTKEIIKKLLENFKPSEVLVQKQFKKQFLNDFGTSFYTFNLEDWVFKIDFAQDLLTRHFKVNSLKGFGIEDQIEGKIAAGGILHYLSETNHKHLSHICNIRRILQENYLWMDSFTIRNLELYSSFGIGEVTLLSIIDKTISPMGGRLLKRWLAFPLKEVSAIKERSSIVNELVENDSILDVFKYQLQQISDIERLISKIAIGKVSPREMNLLKDSLKAIAPIKENAIKAKHENLKKIGNELDLCESLIQKIQTYLLNEAPVNILKGNTIASGVSNELDELRNISHSGKSYLNKILKRESESTNIPSLKIAYNNIFGYYIEVRNTHKDKVPLEWVRKQTLVNAERYITEELKEYETKILVAEERIYELEQELFKDLLEFTIPYVKTIQKNSYILAKLDVLSCFSRIAIENEYILPVVDNSLIIDIKNGRHPVIEKQLSVDQEYIANDIILNPDGQQIIMITGPNMSGKSAVLRQTALIVLLAQIGSYVPATSAKIGVVDKIFTRVGASDNISMGESTFMVEMNESASILNNLSNRSLVLLDEIGRGTSTYDGISIAWAIAEYLHNCKYKPKTLFATHYHELNDMSSIFDNIQNFNVSVKELKDSVIFLRKLVKGGSKHSFGIHVAKLAGMPKDVIHRAQKMLKQLERNHTYEKNKKAIDKMVVEDQVQLNFFQLDDTLLESVKDEILGINIENITPVEALIKLQQVKKLLSGTS